MLLLFLLMMPLAIGVLGIPGTNDILIADPGFNRSGSFHIIPDSFPGIVGVNTNIDVILGNYGNVDTDNAMVTLSYNDWGVTYSGWQEIGTSAFSVPKEEFVEQTYNYVFQDRAHVCLEAKVDASNSGTGGNLDTGNDRTQINWEVVHGDKDYDMWVPFINNARNNIEIVQPEIRCLKDREIVVCDDLKMVLEPFDDNDAVPVELGPGQEQAVFLHIPEIPENEKFVPVVRALMKDENTEEENNVMIRVIKTTVEDLLNEAHLCCLYSVKLRVKLESILVEALTAYEEDNNCKLAITLLSKFVQQATMDECDLGPEELTCMEQAILLVVDAGIMIARKFSQSKPVLLHYLADAFYFRRAGLYEAALLETARICAE